MAGTSIAKTSVALGLESKGFDQGIDKAGQKLGSIDDKAKKVGDGSAAFGKGAGSETFAKIGLVAGGGEILKGLVKGNEALEDMLELTRTIGLGWAVGGVLGAGVALMAVGVKKVADSWDSVWESANKGKTGGLFENIAGGLQIIGSGGLFHGGEDARAKMFRASEQSIGGKGVAAAQKQLEDYGRGLSLTLEDGNAELSEREKFVKKAFGGFPQYGKEAEELADKLGRMFDTLEDRKPELLAIQAGKDSDAFIRSLSMQREMLSKTANEFKLAELAAAGLSDEGIAKVRAAMAELQIEQQQKAVEDWTKSLEKGIATFGMTSEELKRWELRQLGANEAQLQMADSLRAELTEMNAMKDAMKDAEANLKQIGDAGKTPFERFNDQIGQLEADLDMMGITGEKRADLMARGLHQAATQAGILGQQIRDIPALETAKAGTAGAFRALIQAGANMGTKSTPAAELKDGLLQLKAANEAQLKVQKDLLAEWKKINGGNLD